MQLKNQQLQQHNRELEAEVLRLQKIVEQATTAPVLDREQLIEIRDRIVKNWRLAKAPEKRDRIKEALDRFIAEISGVSKKGQPEVVLEQDSTPPSIPASHTSESFL